ncbi:hypothetical protein Tco_0935590 [Tanacetum coccineum]
MDHETPRHVCWPPSEYVSVIFEQVKEFPLPFSDRLYLYMIVLSGYSGCMLPLITSCIRWLIGEDAHLGLQPPSEFRCILVCCRAERIIPPAFNTRNLAFPWDVDWDCLDFLRLRT